MRVQGQNVRHDHDLNRSRGFTLIELVVACSIFMLLAGVILPVYAGSVERRGTDQTRAQMVELEQAIRRYFDDIKLPPPSLQALVDMDQARDIDPLPGDASSLTSPFFTEVSGRLPARGASIAAYWHGPYIAHGVESYSNGAIADQPFLRDGWGRAIEYWVEDERTPFRLDVTGDGLVVVNDLPAPAQQLLDRPGVPVEEASCECLVVLKSKGANVGSSEDDIIHVVNLSDLDRSWKRAETLRELATINAAITDYHRAGGNPDAFEGSWPELHRHLVELGGGIGGLPDLSPGRYGQDDDGNYTDRLGQPLFYFDAFGTPYQIAVDPETGELTDLLSIHVISENVRAFPRPGF